MNPFKMEEKKSAIEGFNGYFSFLSVLHPSNVFYCNKMYPTAAHAFEAARAIDEASRNLILKAPTIQDMIELAATNADPPNWEMHRLVVMEAIQRDKFHRNKELKEKLVLTHPRELINICSSSNSIDDKKANQLKSMESNFWGKYYTKNNSQLKGQNELGRILESIREDINEGSEIEQWLSVSFGLEEETINIPMIKLLVYKEDELLETVSFEKKPLFILGCKVGKVDYEMIHASISRMHACIFIKKEGGGVYLVDIGSKAGTTVNGEKLENSVPILLEKGAIIRFGMSSRSYEVDIDYSHIEEMLKVSKREMEKDLCILEHIERASALEEGEGGTLAMKEAIDLGKQDTVFVGNLPTSFKEDDLEEIMKSFGDVKSVRMPEDYKTQHKRGFGFVEFTTESAATKAALGDGIKILDRKLKIRFADKRIELKYKEKRLENNRREREEELDKDKEGHRKRSRSRSSERYLSPRPMNNRNHHRHHHQHSRNYQQHRSRHNRHHYDDDHDDNDDERFHESRHHNRHHHHEDHHHQHRHQHHHHQHHHHEEENLMLLNERHGISSQSPYQEIDHKEKVGGIETNFEDRMNFMADIGKNSSS